MYFRSLCLQIYFLIVPDCVHKIYTTCDLPAFSVLQFSFDCCCCCWIFSFRLQWKKKTITYGQHYQHLSLPKLKNRISSEMPNIVCVLKEWFIPDEYSEPNTQKPEITAQVAESNLNQSTWYIISVEQMHSKIAQSLSTWTLCRFVLCLYRIDRMIFALLPLPRLPFYYYLHWFVFIRLTIDCFLSFSFVCGRLKLKTKTNTTAKFVWRLFVLSCILNEFETALLFVPSFS